MSTITYRPIGIIHTPFSEAHGAPIQPTGAADAEGRVELDACYAQALQDIEGFSHLILLYHFHRSGPWKPLVVPFLDTEVHGVFATRAPARPNAIGLSVVQLLRREEAVLWIRGIDVIDGTPLLDIKPYVPAFDCPGPARSGWLEGKGAHAATARADTRFAPQRHP